MSGQYPGGSSSSSSSTRSRGVTPYFIYYLVIRTEKGQVSVDQRRGSGAPESADTPVDSRVGEGDPTVDLIGNYAVGIISK